MTFPCRSMICSVEGCATLTVARGYCSTHYSRWLKHGDPTIVKPRGGARVMPPRPPRVWPTCTFDGCENLSAKGCRGWCPKHHTRWYRHGDPSANGNLLRTRRDVMERIRERIRVEDGCWIWQGAKHPSGYGALGTRDKSNYVHRAAWQYVNGPVPKGFHLHHEIGRASCRERV